MLVAPVQQKYTERFNKKIISGTLGFWVIYRIIHSSSYRHQCWIIWLNMGRWC